jgi:hypothetical protein
VASTDFGKFPDFPNVVLGELLEVVSEKGIAQCYYL